MRLLRTNDSIVEVGSSGYAVLAGYKKNGKWTINIYIGTKRCADALVELVNGEEAVVNLGYRSAMIAEKVLAVNNNITVVRDNQARGWKLIEEENKTEYPNYKLTESFM